MPVKSPKVSIVITNYNYADYLSIAIESAINQDYNNVEVIVVDDGSTDNSREIIRQYEDKVIAVFQENMGHIAATNSGFENSSGDLITFLDADDYLFPDLCKRVVNLFEEGVAKVHYKLMDVDVDGNHLGPRPAEQIILSEGDDVYRDVLKGTYITALGNIYNKKLIAGLFPLPIIKTTNSKNYLNTVTPDSYFNPRVPFCGGVRAVQDCLAAYRHHGNNYGATVSPYRSFLKRRRYLMKARIDSDFLLAKSKELNIRINKEILFKRYELLRLRLISLRIDDDHPWPNDNAIYLVYLAVKNMKYKPKSSYLHNAFYIAWMLMISILPAKKLKRKFTDTNTG